MKKLIPIFGFVAVTIIFFWQVFLKGLLPIPTDTIVGLYYPYRDIYAKTNPNGLPFRNFLITDPVRQQYPWRNFTVKSLKELSLPTWNSYSFSGTPNIANFQSAAFYPLNILLLIFSFAYAWTLLIILQPLLAGIFLYFYLRNLKLDQYSSFLGGFIFAFSGFFVTWLEWGTVLHTALWLPLILLSVDRISHLLSYKEKFSIFPTSSSLGWASNFQFSKIYLWSGILIFSVAFSFFAGHLQTFFYLLIFSSIYVLVRVWLNKDKLKHSLVFLFLFLISFLITLPQLVPTLKFISLSARGLDINIWNNPGWFIPLQHFIQFFEPDFFGNPATLNYWGVWNYGELAGYVGVTTLILALLAIFFRRDKKTIFFVSSLIIALIFAFQNPIAKLPYIINFPFISTSQPTRLLFIVDFSLSILAALGLNHLIYKGKLKQVLIPIIIVGFVFAVVFAYLQTEGKSIISMGNLIVVKRNILFPGLIFTLSTAILILLTIIKNTKKNYLLIFLIALTVIDLFRFSWKFNTFSKTQYLYPENPTTSFLKNNVGNYRIATTDARIMAPNFQIMHSLSSVEGYDPLYLQRYGELIAAINRNKPDISSPYGFNRIVRVDNFSTNLTNLLGIKYVLSLSDVSFPGYKKVFSDGQTKIYENENVLPKAFFVKHVELANDKNQAIQLMFDNKFNPKDTAVVENDIPDSLSQGLVKINKYSDNEIILETQNSSIGFLVLTDSYYPTWHAKINGKEQKIILTDFNFRGLIIPAGKNIVVFKNHLL